MIKDILIPQRVDNYYIFPKRILGFDIVNKTEVTASSIYLNGNSILLERFIKEKFESGNQLAHDEKVVNAIKRIIQNFEHNSEIYTAIPSSNVVFKQLKLPFVSHNKIKMVLNYEVEPLLPFSLEGAIIDFIITQEIPKENSSEVIVAAVQKTVVDQHVKLFEDAGVSPSRVLVDLFSLYSLYKIIPSYTNLVDGVALIDIGFDTTRIAYIQNGRLIFMRTLPRGVLSQAKDFAEIYGVTYPDAIEMIMRFGISRHDDKKYNQAIDRVASSFWIDIKFTLQSFSSQVAEEAETKKIILLGQGSKIIGICEFINNFSGVPCEIFRVEGLFENKYIQMKNNLSIPIDNTISLGIALPSEITNKFNLYVLKEFLSTESIINKQLIASGVLVLAIFMLLFGHTFFQVRKLESEITRSQQEVVDILQERFKGISVEEESFDEVVALAGQEIKKEEDVWSVFSGQDRYSLLEYLFVLHTEIDTESPELGLEVKKLTVSSVDNQIVLEGSVKDFDALKKFEKDLRKSKVISYTQDQLKPEFTMKMGLKKV